jgi:hypothetical protein
LEITEAAQMREAWSEHIAASRISRVGALEKSRKIAACGPLKFMKLGFCIPERMHMSWGITQNLGQVQITQLIRSIRATEPMLKTDLPEFNSVD